MFGTTAVFLVALSSCPHKVCSAVQPLRSLVVCVCAAVAGQVSRQSSEVLLLMEEDTLTYKPHRQTCKETGCSEGRQVCHALSKV